VDWPYAAREMFAPLLADVVKLRKPAGQRLRSLCTHRIDPTATDTGYLFYEGRANALYSMTLGRRSSDWEGAGPYR
jgi:hypothetical protein